VNVRTVYSLYPNFVSRAQRMARLIFDTSGRITRARYWLFIGSAVPTTVLLREAYVAAAAWREDTDNFVFDLMVRLLQSFVATFVVVIVIGGAAMTVKRLHDREKSGSWLAHFVVGPALLFWLGQVFLDAHLEAVHSLPYVLQFVALFVFVWGFVELCCRRGTAGDNHFGTDPLQPKIRLPDALRRSAAR